jgi:hypothetical protein
VHRSNMWSAFTPIATKTVRGSETSRCANRVLTRRSKKARLFDYLVGAISRERCPEYARACS